MNHNSQSEHQLAGGAPLANKNEELHKSPATLGKIAHNELTYRGVDWLLNSTIGVSMSYWTARTESGRELFQKPVTNFFSRVLTPMLKTPEKVAEGARWGSMFTSIIIGGAAIVPVMVSLEKKENKKAIIQWFDEKIYGKEKVAKDPEFKEAYAAIDNEPEKDFSTGMVARIAVLAPMIAATVNPDINKHMVKYLYNPIANASKAAAKSLGIQPKKLMQRGMEEIADGDISQAPKFVSDWDFIHRTIGLDFGLTAIYAVAHEITYKTMAVFKHDMSHHSSETPAVAEQPSANVTVNHLLAAKQPTLQREGI